MKNRILSTIFLAIFFLYGCSSAPMDESLKSLESSDGERLSITAQINQLLADGTVVQEIENPHLDLPADIINGQIQKYFQMGNILFALVLTPSMNVGLSLPGDFIPSFAGILFADKNDNAWTKMAEIQDAAPTDKNNPYYLTVADKKLLMTVVDQNGAGSGEGIMKVFALSETGSWDINGCYYFGGQYNDPSTDGDYFAYSVQFSKQTTQPIESCGSIPMISKE